MWDSMEGKRLEMEGACEVGMGMGRGVVA